MSRVKKRTAPPAKQGKAKGNAAPAPKAKRGRKRKPAVPRELPPPTITVDQAMRAQLTIALRRSEQGKTLANHEQRVLRDAWLLDMAPYLWPTSAAAAADLGVSVGTFRAYKDQGCPGIEDHSPIPKHLVLAWLLRTSHQRGGKPGATINDAEELDNEWRRSKLARLNNTLITEAEDRAHQGVIHRMGQLRHHLQNGLPGVVFEVALANQGDRTAAEDAIAQAIDTELRRFVPQRLATTAHHAQTTTSAPTPALPAASAPAPAPGEQTKENNP